MSEAGLMTLGHDALYVPHSTPRRRLREMAVPRMTSFGPYLRRRTFTKLFAHDDFSDNESRSLTFC